MVGSRFSAVYAFTGTGNNRTPSTLIVTETMGTKPSQTERIEFQTGASSSSKGEQSEGDWLTNADRMSNLVVLKRIDDRV